MKRLLNKIKSNPLFTFILGGLIFGSIGIYGANNYQSNSIEYSPTDSSWEVTNVSDAINSLYSMKNELENSEPLGINPLYVVYARDYVGSTFSVAKNMIDNDYFEVASSGSKITCKKDVTLKITATINGIPSTEYGYIYIYKNGSEIITTRAGSLDIKYLEIDVVEGDYFTWKRSGSSEGGALISFSI